MKVEIFLLATLVTVGALVAPKVNLTMIDNSLWPGCGSNIVNLNSSVYWAAGIKDIIDVYSVWYTCWGPDQIMTKNCHTPYYKPWNFHCSHGQNECYGNTYLSCVDGLDSTTTDQAVLFSACFLKNQDKIPGIAQDCAKAAGVDWTTLNTCFSGDQGKDFMTANAKMSAIISESSEYTPTVWVDGKQVSPLTVKAICDAYTGDKPAACK